MFGALCSTYHSRKLADAHAAYAKAMVEAHWREAVKRMPRIEGKTNIPAVPRRA